MANGNRRVTDVSMNPWKPPSAWDQIENKSADAPWTIQGVLGSALRAFGRQPLGALLAVFVLPGLWMVPANILEKLLVPAEEGTYGPAAYGFDTTYGLGASPRSIAVSWAAYAWNSVAGAAQLSAAIDVARGQRVQWRKFATSVARAPLVFLTTAAVILPFEASGLAPFPIYSGTMLLVLLIAVVVMLYAMIRTLFWAPLVIDTRRPFWENLTTSLVWSRGRFWKLFALVLIATCFGIPVFVVEGVVFGELWHVSTAAMGALYALAVAQVYADLVSQTGELSASTNPEP